ncbi:hypothetical protein [Streptomyces sp. H34-S4]|nr:hypothetical protein [Streptomyces sp. H34-S4]MCY0937279.1 hypothetical protein [Streptomyces sp. H34-S4]
MTAGAASTVLLGGGGRHAWENSGESRTESLCGTPSAGTDAEAVTE